MSEKLTVKKVININTNVSDVWNALTNPEITKKYFFSCEAISDWKVGSPIVYKMYKDGKEIIPVKGVILDIETEKILKYTCYIPETENDKTKHTTVTCELFSNNNVTELTVTQGDFEEGDDRFSHTDAGWDLVLNGLKSLLESKK